MNTYTKLATETYNWKVARRHLPTGSAPSFKLSSPVSGGTWATRKTLWNAIQLETLWPGKAPPNGLLISPYLTTNTGATVLNNQNFYFRVDAYRGPGNNLERVCLVSATAGRFVFFKDDDGLSAYPGGLIVSGCYADFLNLTKAYNNTIDLRDAASDNGRGVLALDWEGRGQLCLNMVSTLPANIFLGFAVSGW